MDNVAMLRVIGVLVVGLLVCGPCAVGAVAEFWTEGMHDPESDDVLHAAVSLDNAADSLPAVTLSGILIAVAPVQIAEERPARTSSVTPRQPRAPPLP
jgi:hypothetical protein